MLRRALFWLVAAWGIPTVLALSGCGGEQVNDPFHRPAWSRVADDSLQVTDAGEASAASSRSADHPYLTPERPIRRLALAGPLSRRDAQISGMTWWDDWLILLPQYPSFADPGQAYLYGIPRSDIEAAMSRDSPKVALEPVPIPIDTTRFQEVDGYQGVEAVAFDGDRAFFTIEATGRVAGLLGMRASVASARMNLERVPVSDASSSAAGKTSAEAVPTLTVDHVRSLPVQSQIRNMAYEAVVTHQGSVFGFFEANGANVNPRAEVARFASILEPGDPLSMPALEYRLTDATGVDSEGRFWVTNYLYRGEAGILDPAADSVALAHGVGVSHRTRVVIERLVEFSFHDDRVVRTPTPPIWMHLEEGTGRNWEAIARYEDGFLIATDTFPETILAFVSNPFGRAPRHQRAPSDPSASGRAASGRAASGRAASAKSQPSAVPSAAGFER